MDNLSIVIPTLNEADYLPRVLQAIAEQEYQYPFEVIVVDGNSEDRTVEIARTFQDKIKNLQVIESLSRGVGLQRNIGAKHAVYDHILFLDSDVYLPKKFLNRLQLKIKNDSNLILLVLHRPPHFNILDYLWLLLLFSFIWIVQWFKPICSGSFLLTTKNNHEQVGGFDENIVMAEDVFYCHQSIKLGAKYKLLFAPSVVGDPRRLREMGRIKLLILWLKGYIFTITKGPIYKSNQFFDYEFGKHKK